MADSEERYRTRSLWLDSLAGTLSPRPALDRDVDVDVAIVGAGYTGLWTAYELVKGDPTLRVAVLEAEIAGFGASGRNGGWCSALFAGSREATAKAHGREAAVALQRAMFTTVDAVGAVLDDEGIDADFVKGGTLDLATTQLQEARVCGAGRATSAPGASVRRTSAGWSPTRPRTACASPGRHGAVYTPHCARVHPARLARGLADAAERRGVTVYERTRVTEISPAGCDDPRPRAGRRRRARDRGLHRAAAGASGGPSRRSTR